MTVLGVILAATNVLCGILAILLALPLLRGRVGRNWLYGVRIRKAFESDETWYLLNRYGARRLIVWSVVLIVLGAASLLLPVDEASPAWAIAVGCLPLLLVVPCVETIRFARRLDGRRSDRP